MNVDELLDLLDEMMDKALHLPLTGGRSLIEVDKIREILDDVRLNMPQEIRQAKAIVADRSDIIKDAKREAEAIIKQSEERARVLVSEEEVVKSAQAKANEILSQAQMKSKEVRQAASDFAEAIMKKLEETYSEGITQTRQARQAIRQMK